jgi:hypothetical protein
MRTLVLAAAVLAAGLAAAATANAGTVAIDVNDNFGGDAPSYSVVDASFVLPAGFSNAVLTLSTFAADDRTVAYLNGTVIGDTGIYGPGEGSFFYTANGPNVPLYFEYGNAGPFAPVTGPFVAGTNTIELIVNNTGNGIYGGPSGGPSGVYLDGTVTYGGGVPEPATWAMLILGLGAIGATLRSRRSIAVAA